LYNQGGKPDSNYPDLEPGREFWNQVWVCGSDYKSLVSTHLAKLKTNKNDINVVINNNTVVNAALL